MAGDHGFYRYPIACLEIPATCRSVTNRSDTAERFMAGHHRHRRTQHTLVLFVVGTADTTGFDSENCAVIVNLRQGNVPTAQFPNTRLYHGKSGFRQQNARSCNKMKM